MVNYHHALATIAYDCLEQTVQDDIEYRCVYHGIINRKECYKIFIESGEISFNFVFVEDGDKSLIKSVIKKLKFKQGNEDFEKFLTLYMLRRNHV